jgi:hypothetical protein
MVAMEAKPSSSNGHLVSICHRISKMFNWATFNFNLGRILVFTKPSTPYLIEMQIGAC